MNIKKISADEFLKKREQETALPLVDVRTAAEIKSEYLRGSLHLPLHEVSVDRLTELLSDKFKSKGESVYLLCGTGMRAEKAVEQLKGYSSELVVVEGGLNTLKEKGCALEQGDGDVISLERQVRIAAGSFVLLGAALGATVAPAFYGVSAFVGAGLIFAGITDTCGMAMVLARMPWNK